MIFRTNVVRQNKREGCTTLTTVAMVADVCRWSFFGFYTHSEHFLKQVSTKREVLKTSHRSSRGLKKFSTHFYDPLCVLGMIFRTNVVRQNKRGGRTTLRAVAMVADVRRWSFFGFHSPSEQFLKQISTKSVENRVFENDNVEFERPAKIFDALLQPIMCTRDDL